MHAAIGLGVATGLLALLPSKREQEMDTPWISILLAILSGISFAVGL